MSVGELSIVEIESGRDAHWPLWPFYVGQRTTVTDTGSLPRVFRSIVRLALESGLRERAIVSDCGPSSSGCFGAGRSLTGGS